MPDALARHDATLQAAVEAHRGRVFKHTGDGVCAVFGVAADAVAAAVDAQVALRTQQWDETGPLRARMAVHAGTVDERAGDYYGRTLNRCARLLEAAHGGQVIFSQTVAELITDDPSGEVEVLCLGEHRLRDLTGAERIYQLVCPGLPDRFAPLRTLDALPHNLPQQLTSLVGRERELREVLGLLGESRLLTLTGVGGCGKTRLALQAAADASTHYPDGVRLVELAPLADASLVAAQVAGAVGLSDAPGVSGTLEERLVEALSAKTILLVLDNCEHVVGAVAGLADLLLGGCRDLAVLATSREPVGIAGERVWPVPPLGGADAIALFVERARAVVPSFSVAGDGQSVRRVCERLDGIPLAIELAAARVRHLSPDEIAARLQDSFDVLAGGARTALPRQRTLRAALDWSHDLLARNEQVLFRRLCVFAGGWTLAAAEAICPEDPLAAEDVLELLAVLVDKSLVVVEEPAGGATRYRLLEPVRQYAAQRLAADGHPGEAQRLARRHRDWCLDLARGAGLNLFTQSRQWLPRVAPERDNFRAALEYSATAADDEALLRLVVALYTFWVTGGHIGEGRRWAERALLLEDAGSPRLRALVMDAAGQLDQYQGDYDTAIALHRRAIEISRREGERGLAWSLFGLGRALTFRGDRDAIAPLGESLRLSLELGYFVLAAWSQFCLAQLDFLAGNWSRAEERYRKAGTVAERAGYPGLQGLVLVARGATAALSGDVPAGRSLCDRGVAILEADGDRWTQHWGYVQAAALALLASDPAQARRHVGRSQRLARESGGHENLEMTLGYAAVLVASDGHHEPAARIWGAAESIGAAIGVAPQWRAAFSAVEEPQRQTTERALGEAAMRRADATGRAMSIEQAIALALDQLGAT